MKRIACLIAALVLCLATGLARASEVQVACCDCDGSAGCGAKGCGAAGCDTAGCDTAKCGVGCDGAACNRACDAKACSKGACGGTACDGGCATCDGLAGCGGGCCRCKPRLFGLFAPSDHRFDNFISPITNPVFFEDPRTLTEARFIFFHHKIPREVGGGTAQLMAMQLRAALTDRLSIVAAKDGYITTSHPIVDDGWADVYVGLKYNLWADPFAQRLLSIGASYELPVGSSTAFQANGDGEFHLYLTGGAQIGCKSHWLSAGGVRLPVDRNDNSQSWYWSNHVDRHLFGCVYALAEANWYHWFGSGQNGLNGIEGLDVINFGSTNVAGNDIVTGAVGVKLKPSGGTEIGVAWEIPLTDRRDIIDSRLTVDWIVRY